MKVPTSKQLPSGKWFVRVRVGGKDVSRAFDTQKDADAWALATKAQGLIEKGNDTAGQRTVKKIMEDYIDTMTGVYAANTISTYKSVLNHFKSIMNTKFDSVSNWQKAVNQELVKYNPNTVALHWAKLSTAFRYYGLDVPKVKIKQKSSKVKDYLTPEQIPMFLEAIKGDRFEVLYLMMLSSMRISEALSIEPKDITEKGIHVRGTKTTAADRVIPWIIPRLQELLIPYQPYHTASPAKVRDHLYKICDENNFPHLTNHSLRVSFASLCYEKNVPERVAMRIGGWADITTMHRIYVRISDDQVSEYADTLRSFFS